MFQFNCSWFVSKFRNSPRLFASWHMNKTKKIHRTYFSLLYCFILFQKEVQVISITVFKNCAEPKGIHKMCQYLRSLSCIALRILTAQNFTRNKRVWVRAHKQNGSFFQCGLVRERSKLSLSRKRVWWPINFFLYFGCSDQILSVKWKQINFYVWKKKMIAKNVYFGSTRREIIKELYGIYKVFLLLNESGDPPFLFQNLSSLKGKTSRRSLVKILCSVLCQGNDLKEARCSFFSRRVVVLKIKII